jgi:hypothetical protein
MLHFPRRIVACAALTAALMINILDGQTGAGSLQGTVRDPSGAVVPGAQVSAARTDTGRKYETATNDAGLFLFPAMDPGPYRVSVRVTGMQTWEGDLQLATAQAASVEVTMKVGTAAQELTVAGEISSPVDTVSATLATTVEHQRIEQLPLDGRSVATLVVETSPGVDEGSGSTNRSAANLPRVFGLKWGAMEFLQDGAAMMNRYWGWLAVRPPGLDTVQEFRVEDSNSSAKYDHPATTIIMTKSGTNQLHGAMFETARNSGLAYDRRRQDFFSKPPTLIRNEYGASLGGPVVIPKLYKGVNRTFFFVSYEGYDLRQYSTTGTEVPTPAMRQGDFSGLKGSDGIAITIYDPLTSGSAAQNYARSPFPGNVIPVTREGPVAKYLYSTWPLPNVSTVNPVVGNNLFWPSPNNRDDRTGTMRLDHSFSPKNAAFLRFSDGVVSTLAANGYNGAPITLNNVTNFYTNDVSDPSVALSWTHVFNPTLFSETLANFSLERWRQIAGDRSQNYAAQLGIPNPFNQTGFPEIRNTGLTGLDTGESGNTEKNTTRIFTFDENMTKVWGKHEIQFGGRVHYERLDEFPQQQFAVDLLYFNSGATALCDPSTAGCSSAAPHTGFDNAAFFLGAGSYFSTLLNRGYYRFSSSEYAGYVQDNYRATSRLTLNFGLRLESYPLAKEANNLLVGWDPKNYAIVTGQPLSKLYAMGVTTPGIINTYTSIGVNFETAQQAGQPDNLSRTDLFNYGPRFGAAYRLTDGRRPLVVRGGFSRYSFPIPVRYYVQRARSAIPLSTRYTLDYSQSAQSPDGKVNYSLRNAPPFIVGDSTANLLDPNNPAAVARGSFTTTYFAPYLPATRADEWNVTFEKEVFANTLLRASYVGTRGFNLDQLYDTNQAPSNYVWEVTTGGTVPTSGAFSGVATRLWPTQPYGTVEEYTKNGYSNFNGGLLQFERRYSRGMAFQVFYVLSSAMRLGGNGWYDSFAVDPNIFLPGTVPANFNQLNKLLNYQRDPEIPKNHLRWNWVVDLPFGRGKWIGRNSSGWVDKIIGGWQFAGSGNMVSRYFALPTTYWGATTRPQVYGLKDPVQDCRSGTCYAGYLYYNGYIPPTQVNQVNAAGKCIGVCGVPSSYQPSVTPIDNTPGTQYYGTNTVAVKLANGTVQNIAYANGENPWQNQYITGPLLWTTNASLFKAVKIRERMALRFNADFFNVLNQAGLSLPDPSTGILSLQNSAQSARQLQLTLRLIW